MIRIIFLLGFVLFTVYSAPAPPDVPLQFVAKIRGSVGSISRPSLLNLLIPYPPGYFFFDAVNQRLRVDNAVNLPYGFLNVSTIELPKEGYQIMNDQCRRQFDTKLDLDMWFSWVHNREAFWNGTREIDGQITDEWLYFTKDNSTFRQLNVIVNSNIPVHVYTKYTVQMTKNISKPIETEFFFDKVFLSPPEEWLFVPPADCFTEGFICQYEGIKNLTMFTFEPDDSQFLFSVADQDCGDALGDTAFGCVDLLNNGTLWDDSAYVIQYIVAANSSWGQYSLCNYEICLGNNPVQVGREISFSMTQYGGQCSKDSDIGYWFSFRTPGECKENEEIGTNGCTWKTLQRVKAISTKCLQHMGFQEACAVSFQKASEVFLKAFKDCPAMYPWQK